MKHKLIIYLLCFLLSACGLKKPLDDPDTYYPDEPDCECENE